MPRFLAALPRRLFLAVMLVGSAFITAASLAYFDFDTLPPFVIEKLPVRFETLWLTSLRIHVAAAALAFPLCLALMTRALQRRVTWHRWLGRLSGVLVLFALVPSGVVLSFDAKGGAIVTVGFLLSAAIIAWFMVRGVQAARRHDLPLHARAMRHVVAQMSVAVTSRLLLLGFDAVGIDPDLAYVIALWGPVLTSAAVVDLVSVRAPLRSLGSSFSRPLLRSLSQIIERIRRALPSQDLPVRVRAFDRPRLRATGRLGR